jgi:hypothetical protein
LYGATCAGMGDAWRRARRRALEPYALAAEDTKQLLDDRQFAVVRGACRAAGFPIGRRPAAREDVASRTR